MAASPQEQEQLLENWKLKKDECSYFHLVEVFPLFKDWFLCCIAGKNGCVGGMCLKVS